MPATSSQNKSLINVENLSKHFKVLNKDGGFKGALKALFSRDYKTVEAVREISFKINEGELVGYVGPNGAGKSTTIKMLTGVLYSSGGEINIDGQNPFKDRISFTRKIGVMFGQKTQLWWDLPLRESFDLLRSIYKIPNDRYQQNLNYFDETLGLKEYWSQPVRRLSLGQRVKGDLVAALLHDPKVLFLDEPTIGLDVLARNSLREIILSINKERNTTVLITSHDLDDIEEIARRLMLIDKGDLLYDGELKSFLQKYSKTGVMNITFSAKISDRKISSILKKNGKLITGIQAVQCDSNQIEIEFEKAKIKYSKLLTLANKLGAIQDFQIKSADLESILTEQYRNK